MRAEPVAQGDEKPVEQLPVRRTSVPAHVDDHVTYSIEIHQHDRLHVEDLDPCLLGKHRPAWLNGGGVACGRCGARL